jgi:ketosteroid isomerase-like protein
MSDLHPNAHTDLAALDAFNRNDLASLRKLAAADFVYRIPGRSTGVEDFWGTSNEAEALASGRGGP